MKSVRRWGKYPGWVIITRKTCTAIWQDKKGCIYGTLLSVSYHSHLVKGTTTVIPLSLSQGPDKNLSVLPQVLPKDCSSLHRRFHPNSLANVTHLTEHISCNQILTFLTHIDTNTCWDNIIIFSPSEHRKHHLNLKWGDLIF